MVFPEFFSKKTRFKPASLQASLMFQKIAGVAAILAASSFAPAKLSPPVKVIPRVFFKNSLQACLHAGKMLLANWPNLIYNLKQD